MPTSAPRTWRLVLPSAAAALALGATAAAALDTTTPAAAPVGAEPVAALLGAAAPPGVDLRAVDLARPPRVGLPQEASVGALGVAVARLARTMGVAEPPASAALADLPPVVRGGLVQALDVLTVCTATTRAAVDGLGGVAGLAAALRQERAADATVAVRLRGCASDLREALAGVGLAVRTTPATRTASRQDDRSCLPTHALWPVLAVDLEQDDDNCYRRDYALLVDAGGEDLYDNNAGSNLLDVLRGGEDEGARAQGCRHAIAGLVARDCVPLAAALLDLSGDDRYGVLEPPFGDLLISVPVDPPQAPLPDPFETLRPTDRPGDVNCTREDVVARLSTQGAGLLGVGMLVDSAGDDVYQGKTGSQGTGHFYGVGALLDEGGDDRYTAVRNSQGFGLFGGSGLLADSSGDDTYAFRMPAPRNGASVTTDGEEPVFIKSVLNPARGIGGVVDDAAHCDRIPRFLQGAANVTALGVLLDRSGTDAYTGGAGLNGDEPITANRAERVTGSQGFGSQGSVGLLLDVQEGPGGGKGAKGREGDAYSEADRGNDRYRVDCTLGGGAGLFVDAATGAPSQDGATTSACGTALTGAPASPAGRRAG